MLSELANSDAFMELGVSRTWNARVGSAMASSATKVKNKVRRRRFTERAEDEAPFEGPTQRLRLGSGEPTTLTAEVRLVHQQAARMR